MLYRKYDSVVVLSIVMTSFFLTACGQGSMQDESVDATLNNQVSNEPLSSANSTSDLDIVVLSPSPAPNVEIDNAPQLGAAVAAVEESEQEPAPQPNPEPSTQSAPKQEFCEGYVSHTESLTIPSIPKPGYLSSYNDPVFESRVIRITDSGFGEVNKPVYSTMQAWNADESLLLLYRAGANSPGHKLHDGHTYEFIRNLDVSPPDIEEIFWSRLDPDIFFYISKKSNDFGSFNQFNVSSNTSTQLADFGDYCGLGLPNAGNDVQMHAVNDDVFGFICDNDDGTQLMLSYKRSTNSIDAAPIGEGTLWNDWSAPVPAPSGTRYWHQGYVVDNGLQQIVHQLDMANPLEHSSIGMSATGEDAYYQVAFNRSPDGCDGDLYEGVGHLVEHDLATGGCRNIISQENGYPYTTSSTHISAQAYLQPERIALSSIGKASQNHFLADQTPAPVLFSEIYVAQTTPGDTKVCRLAHHRSLGKAAVNGGYASYFGEPHATISPSGTRVIFGSDWYDSGSVDSYVIELPDYTKP